MLLAYLVYLKKKLWTTTKLLFSAQEEGFYGDEDEGDEIVERLV